MTRTADVLVFVACALGAMRTASAADEPRREEAAPRLLRVYVAAAPKTIAKMAVTVRELCARLRLDVIVLEASDENVLAKSEPRAWLEAFIDLKSPTSPRIVVIDPESRRELERRTFPGSSSLELSVEAAAHVLYMAAESALSARDEHVAPEAGAVAPANEASPPPAPVVLGEEKEKAAPRKPLEARHDSTKKSPVPAAERDEVAPGSDPADKGGAARRASAARFHSEIGAFGSVAAFAVSQPLVGFGGTFDAGSQSGALRFSAALSGTAYLPSSLARQGATASLAAESARLSAVAAWEATRAFAPFIAIGGGADRIVLDTGPAPAGAWASGADTRVDPMLEGMLGAKMRFSTLVGAFFGFAMDVDLAPHRYVIDEGGAKETFFDLGRVRPTALVGLSMLVADTGNRATSAETGP